ncbi:MAG: gliding motility protein GldL [Bacteroidales bacterium]|nr:gliding motility protein GldL [Bacteroidales bacterium]
MAKTKEELSGFQKFLVSKRFKKIMGYFYGWGAAVVMIGAYFKLTHIPGADFMLALGLGIEAVIFFLSAFEPQHVDYAWDNVFVELEEDWDGETRTQFSTANTVNTNSSISSPLMDEAMNNAMAATNGYAKAMEQASKTISDFANNYTKTNEQLTDSLNKLDFSALDTNTLRKVATSMQSLNSICEIQLQSMEQTSSASSKLAATMTSYMDNLNASANNANELNKQLNQLSSRLSALNNVYGGMLSAMNIKA